VKGDPEMMEAGGFRYISDADFPDVVEALSHGSGGRKPNPYLTATEKERKLIAKFKDKEGKPLDVSSSYLVKDTDKARRAHHYLMALLDGESGKRYGQDFKGLSFIPTLCAAFFSKSFWRHPTYKEASFEGWTSIGARVGEINKYLAMAGGGEDYARLLELAGITNLRQLGTRAPDVMDLNTKKMIPDFKRRNKWKKLLKKCQVTINRLEGLPGLGTHDKSALEDARTLLRLINPSKLGSLFDDIKKNNIFWLVPSDWGSSGRVRDVQTSLELGSFQDADEAKEWLEKYVNHPNHSVLSFHGTDVYGSAGTTYVNEMERLLLDKDDADNAEVAHLTPAMIYAQGREKHLAGKDGEPALSLLRRVLGEEGPMMETPDDYEHEHIGDTGYWREVKGGPSERLEGVPRPAVPSPEFEGPGPVPLSDVKTVEGDKDSFDVMRSEEPIEQAWDNILKNVRAG